MKKNGFTIIELLVTITILAALSVVIGVSMSSMLERQNENEIEKYKQKVYDACEVYAELHSTETRVSIDTLKSEGYLDKNLTNPDPENPEIKENLTIDKYKCEFERN